MGTLGCPVINKAKTLGCPMCVGIHAAQTTLVRASSESKKKNIIGVMFVRNLYQTQHCCHAIGIYIKHSTVAMLLDTSGLLCILRDGQVYMDPWLLGITDIFSINDPFNCLEHMLGQLLRMLS